MIRPSLHEPCHCCTNAVKPCILLTNQIELILVACRPSHRNRCDKFDNWVHHTFTYRSESLALCFPVAIGERKSQERLRSYTCRRVISMSVKVEFRQGCDSWLSLCRVGAFTMSFLTDVLKVSLLSLPFLVRVWEGRSFCDGVWSTISTFQTLFGFPFLGRPSEEYRATEPWKVLIGSLLFFL